MCICGMLMLRYVRYCYYYTEYVSDIYQIICVMYCSTRPLLHTILAVVQRPKNSVVIGLAGNQVWFQVRVIRCHQEPNVNTSLRERTMRTFGFTLLCIEGVPRYIYYDVFSYISIRCFEFYT